MSKHGWQTKAASLINLTMKYRSKTPGIKTRKGPLGFYINGHVGGFCCVYVHVYGGYTLYIFIAEQILKLTSFTHYFLECKAVDQP